MITQRISASAQIDAPASRVYAIIADYQHGHPRILPKPPFVGLEVEQGGVGAGTTIHVHMRVLGRAQSFRAIVTEPEPGRVLVETNDNGYTTTFTVEPRVGGEHAFVTIATETTVPDGPVGALQAWIITRILQPTYKKELAQLADVAAERTS